MKKATLAICAIFLGSYSAVADDCRERVVFLVMDSMKVRPSEGHLISEVTGQPKTENLFIAADLDHTLYKSISPANQPWTLTYKGAMYQSSDEGKSWKKVHSFDSEKQRAAIIASVTEQAKSATNAVCGEEELDGVMHDTFEADFSVSKPTKMDMHNKYWRNRETGFVTKSTSRVKVTGAESFTTQTWKFLDKVELPIPD
ncbi:MAG: hypothetical protein KDJ17_08625 [Hyphomicrobiaceae bacterium]|nr:hypothetical protein [Hyphomicrobiaceae bacterium]